MSLSVDVAAQRGDFEVTAAFEATAGETVALLGPNGAGKSTLVDVLAGLLPPRTGIVRLSGVMLDGPGVHLVPQRRRVGVVFQDRALFPHLTALENVAFGLRARGVPKRQADARARAVLEAVGVAALQGRRPGALSGGQAQAVAVARALVLEPDLMLFDEPTASLDVSARMEVHDLLRSSAARTAGVRMLVTHDPAEAMTLADRAVIIEAGRVVQTGSWDALRDRPASDWIAELVGLNRFTGTLRVAADGDANLVLPNGTQIACGPVRRSPGPAVAVVAPVDVALHASRPEGSSRNLIRGRVRAVDLAGMGARVRLEADPSLVAQVTVDSVRRMGIVPGMVLWASFKAVEVRVLD